MKTKYNSITIGIPAYNEQNNIARLLAALSQQRTTGSRRIESIIVMSDGSTDDTVKEARMVSNPKIKIINGKNRLGKNGRLNKLYRTTGTDVLVLLDADIVLEGQYAIDTLVKAFHKVKNCGMVAGNAQPLAGKTIYEDAANNFIASLNFMKEKIKRGQNIYSVRGPILAFSKELVKNYVLPLDVPDDRYSYFLCKRLGFEMYYEQNAKVYFRSPKTFSDQIRQCKRFRTDRLALNSYLSQKELNEAYFMPFSLKIQGLIYQLTRNPLAYFVMKCIQIYDHATMGETKRATWDIAHTTKSFL